jgi:hypothetical protein
MIRPGFAALGNQLSQLPLGWAIGVCRVGLAALFLALRWIGGLLGRMRPRWRLLVLGAYSWRALSAQCEC